jgi:hypothetical protein
LLPQLDDLQHQFDALILGFVGGAEIWILQLALQAVVQAGVRAVMGCRRAAAVRSFHAISHQANINHPLDTLKVR